MAGGSINAFFGALGPQLSMQTYRCTCGNRLFFDNTVCVVCQAEVGWCECCHRITTLEPMASNSANGAGGAVGDESDGAGVTANPDGGNDYRCGNVDCRALLRKCHNFAVEDVCNRLFDPTNRTAADFPPALAVTPSPPAFPGAMTDAQQPPINGAPLPANGAPAPLPIDGAPAPLPPIMVQAVPVECLCGACQLNETIPDLTIAGHREKWARLEAAKRRLLYTLDRLSLPYADADLRLSFDFKADLEPLAQDWKNSGPTEVVYTGHADGKITINIREADDAEREKLRVMYGEGHRTLIGHFHHEVGHYYWQLLVEGHRTREQHFINLFGDHNNPPYADAMAAYYQNGPREGWPGSFISAYASAHPWEDFAETFALYLDIIAVLDTASHLFKTIKANFRGRSVAPLVERFQEIGILENEFNRTMGLIDLVPEVVAAPVVAKLQFIHDVLRSAGKTRRKRSTEPAAAEETPSELGEPASETPIPMLMQQGSVHYYEPPTFEPAILIGGRP
jgi:hypothetical protein